MKTTAITVGERLKAAREGLGMSMDELADRMNYKSRNSIYKIEHGKVDLPLSKVVELANVLGIDPAYLMGWTENPGFIEVKKSAGKIPVYDHIAAGPENFLNAVPDDWMDFTPHDEADYFAARVKGDSMFPKILNGDTVICRRQSDVESGQTAVVMVDGEEGTCKRIVKSPEGITLVADNPAVFPPRFYSNEEIESIPIRILGRVIKAITEF